VSDAAYSLDPESEEEPPATNSLQQGNTIRARPVPRINIQAFCEDQDTAATIQHASEDRRLSKTHVNVRMGGIDAAVAFFRSSSTPNLIVIESFLKGDALLAEMDRLAEVCDPGTKVIAIGHVNDVLLYRELMKRGVSEEEARHVQC